MVSKSASLTVTVASLVSGIVALSFCSAAVNDAFLALGLVRTKPDALLFTTESTSSRSTGNLASAGTSGVYDVTPALGLSMLGASALYLIARRPAAIKQHAQNALISQRSKNKAVSVRAFETELGVQPPTGFWDPLNLSKDGDISTFKRRRASEIKHGRISMLATMGYITPELVGKFPGYLSPYYGVKYVDIPNGLAAISKVPLAGWFQIVLYCLYCEASGLGFGYFDAFVNTEEVGNLGWKPPLLATSDKELRKKRLNSELANGRLSMMAIIGMFFSRWFDRKRMG